MVAKESRRHFIRMLAVSGVALLVVAGAGLGATLAYFAAQRTAQPHVTAGSIDLELYYEGSYGRIVKEGEGHPSVVTKDEGLLADPVNVTTTNGHLFNIENAQPSMDYQEMYYVENTANTDFNLYVSLANLTYDNTHAPSVAMIELVTITVRNSAGTIIVPEMKASEIPATGTEFEMVNVAEDFVLVGEKEHFEVEIKWENNTPAIDNPAQHGTFAFDLTVEARNVTE